MIINHNIAALNTYRQLTVNNTLGNKALEKLSAGLRINRAGDDAAGLAISEKMRAQIRGLDQAARNAQDGISMIQTAEGALNETHAILQRMRELATQAGNDTYTASDRAEIQNEINQLTSELNRIGNTTEFNTQKLLRGSAQYNDVKVTQLTAPTVATGTVSPVNKVQDYQPATPSMGTITLNGAPVDGDKIELAGLTFEFDTNNTVSGTNISVQIQSGGSVADAIKNLAEKIKDLQTNGTDTQKEALKGISVSYNETTITLTNADGDNTIEINANFKTSDNVTISPFAGGKKAQAAKFEFEITNNLANKERISVAGTLLTAGTDFVVGTTAAQTAANIAAALNGKSDFAYSVTATGAKITLTQKTPADPTGNEPKVKVLGPLPESTTPTTPTEPTGVVKVEIVTVETKTEGGSGTPGVYKFDLPELGNKAQATIKVGTVAEDQILTINNVTIEFYNSSGGTADQSAAKSIDIKNLTASGIAAKIAELEIAGVELTDNGDGTVTITAATAGTAGNDIKISHSAATGITKTDGTSISGGLSLSDGENAGNGTISKITIDGTDITINSTDDLRAVANKINTNDTLKAKYTAEVIKDGDNMKLQLTQVEGSATAPTVTKTVSTSAAGIALNGTAFTSDNYTTAQIKQLQEKLPFWINDALKTLKDNWDIALPDTKINLNIEFVEGESYGAQMSYDGTDLTLKVDVEDFFNANGELKETSDTLIAHEMFHAIQLTQFKGLKSTDTWFMEGLSMAIQGGNTFFGTGDDTFEITELASGSNRDLTGTFGSTTKDYVKAYAAVKTLHEVIDGGIDALIDKLEEGKTLDEAIKAVDFKASGTALSGSTGIKDFQTWSEFATWFKSSDDTALNGYFASGQTDFKDGTGAITAAATKGSSSNLTPENTIANGTTTELVDASYTLNFINAPAETTSASYDTSVSQAAVNVANKAALLNVNYATATTNKIKLNGQEITLTEVSKLNGTTTPITKEALKTALQADIDAVYNGTAFAGMSFTVDIDSAGVISISSNDVGSTVSVDLEGTDVSEGSIANLLGFTSADTAYGTDAGAGLYEFSLDKLLGDGAKIKIDGQEIMVVQDTQKYQVQLEAGIAMRVGSTLEEQINNLAEAINANSELSAKYVTNVVTDGSTTKLELAQVVASNTAPDISYDTGKFSVRMQIGANTGQSFSIEISDMRATGLGVSSTVSDLHQVVEVDGKKYNVAYRQTKEITNGTDDVAIEYALDVTTHDNATAAITVINDAIAKVSAERSKLGAMQNRLEHTINNLGTSSENLTAAESRIRDVDMAKEMMEFTKMNILSQAAQAMLAQANQQPQGVLQLLR
jgi:flagellin-like hook-associated protein FlgL